MNPLRERLSRRLRELGVEERPWPGREGFASLLLRGREFAHFHDDTELDIRLGKAVIQRERLARLPDSKIHPDRSPNSSWYEMRFVDEAGVEEALRLVRIALAGLAAKK